MSEVRFYLLYAQKFPDRMSPIYLRWMVTPGDRLEYSLGSNFTVHPDDWDKKRQEVKPTDSASASYNLVLNTIKVELRREFAKILASGRTPTSGKMRDRLEVLLGRGKRDDKNHTLLTFTEMLAKQDKESGSTHTRRLNLASMLRKFAKVYRRSFYFDDLDHKFWKAFEEFLIKRGISDYYASRLQSSLQTMVKKAASSEYGLTTNTDILNYKSKIKAQGQTKVFLTLEEVLQLYNYQPEEERLINVRDCFVFACLSGLRFVDWKQVDANSLLSIQAAGFTFYEVAITAKSERQAFIPMFPQSVEILSRHGGKLPIISAQKTNDYLKELARAAGIDAPFNFIESRGGNKTAELLPKWKKLSAHAARRTMSHLLKMEGMEEEYINLICGWTGRETMAQRYDKSEFTQIASRENFSKPLRELAKKLNQGKERIIMF